MRDASDAMQYDVEGSQHNSEDHLASILVDGEDSNHGGGHEDNADDDRGQQRGVLSHAQAAEDHRGIENHGVYTWGHKKKSLHKQDPQNAAPLPAQYLGFIFYG